VTDALLESFAGTFVVSVVSSESPKSGSSICDAVEPEVDTATGASVGASEG